MKAKQCNIVLAGIVLTLTSSAIADSFNHKPIIPNLPSSPIFSASTVSATNGDQNPYGVAFVPSGFVTGGSLNPGDIIVSNFNNSTAAGNTQGTGTSIVRVTPGGQTSVFFQNANAP